MAIDLASEFSLQPDIVYLNHAAVSPWPRRTAAVVAGFAEENCKRGAQHYPDWLAVEQRLRQRLQRLIGARSPDEVALLKNTSEGLSVIAHGLDWKRGDNVVIPAQEFPSNRIVWESLSIYGVEVRGVDIYSQHDPEAALLAAVDRRTRLLSVSSVQFDTGLRLDLARLGRGCESAEILYCVDAIQSLGAYPLDVREIRADFVVADGHKWMLAPEGLALFYCRRELLERLRLHEFGWHMTTHPHEFNQSDWKPSITARRFECGSPNMLGIHALEASLSVLEDIGITRIADLITDNAMYLIEILDNIKHEYALLTPLESTRHAGIVSFRPLRRDVNELHRRLTAANVICAVRSGALRFSPHCYTTREQLDRALTQLI